MEVGGSQGWGVVGSSTGWGVGTADRPPVAAPSSSKDLREDSRGRFGGRLTSAMLEKALSGGGGAASGTVAGSSTSSTSATGAIPDVAPSTHLTTPLPSGSRTNPPPTGSALAEQLAVVAGAAHSYEQLMEITRGWHLPLKAVDLAWTTAQRSREKGKGRASDTSLTAPAEVEYLGPPLNNRELRFLGVLSAKGPMLTAASLHQLPSGTNYLSSQDSSLAYLLLLPSCELLPPFRTVREPFLAPSLPHH